MEIKNVLNKEFANLCEWIVDNKLSIHFDEETLNTFFLVRKKSMPVQQQYNKTISYSRIPWLLSGGQFKWIIHGN